MKTVTADQVVYKLGPENRAVLEVEPGEEVTFLTQDCFCNRYQTDDCEFDNSDWEHVNPATGPVAVKGAMPGDTLVVDILDVKIPDEGVLLAYPGELALGPRISGYEIKTVKAEGDKARLFGLDIPLNPMVGVMGVSPADATIRTDTPGAHGGNMDNKYVRAGARMYFPVFVPGGNLVMGDLHSAMADGEVFTGIEVPGEVTVRVSLLKGQRINWPRLEDDERFMVIVSDHDLDEAVEISIDEMADIVMERLGLTLNQAGMLLTLVGQTEICQVVDPCKTARMVVPKWIFDKK